MDLIKEYGLKVDERIQQSKKEAIQNLEQQGQQRQATSGACILCTLSCNNG